MNKTRSVEGKRRRVTSLKSRIQSRNVDYFPLCTIPFCGRPTERAARRGLSRFHCENHVAHLRRHGSTWCRTPSAALLKIYRNASLTFFRKNPRDPELVRALAELKDLLAYSPAAEAVTRLRGKSPRVRAMQAISRIEARGVLPNELLAVVAAVHCLFEDRPELVHRTAEFRRVAIAKRVHALAGGLRKEWKLEDATGKVVQRTELRSFPPSSGRILRILGELVERPCELAVRKHVTAILALITRPQRQASSKRYFH